MAKIRVYRREAGGKYFPRVCMKCGREADRDVPNTFTWVPSWVHVLILLGLAPWLIVALVMRKSMAVVVPMCDRHAGHWRVRKLYMWLGLLFWVVYAVGFVVLENRVPEAARTPLALAGIIGSLVWLVSMAIFMYSAIRANTITDDWADLVGVDKEFAREWNSM